LSLKLRRSVFDRRDGKTGPYNYSTKFFYSDSYEYISAQNGYVTVHAPDSTPNHRWHKFNSSKLESLTKKTGGNKSPNGGKMYPWPIRAEGGINDIFCQIFKQSEEKFIDSKNCICINSTNLTIDDWLRFYITELIEELKYERNYHSAED
jgi:hypothetical protein